MKKFNLPLGSIRVTRDPELFIYPFISENQKGYWRLVNSAHHSLGVYTTDLEAKAAAQSHASRFLKAPKKYREAYAQKLNSFERIRREQMGMEDEDTD